jgi:hypothetical protein
MLGELTHGAEAAAILGVARSDDVWRAVSRHGADYPGRVEIIRVGKTNAARRDELQAFAAWYRANVTATRWANRRGTEKPEPDKPEPEKSRERKPLDERREKLRAAIGRITEERESELW